MEIKKKKKEAEEKVETASQYGRNLKELISKR